MAKLTHYHDITEKRNFGKETVNQRMETVVDYDPSDDSIQVSEVNIYQNGVKVCEISKLLDKAEGEPLIAIIEAVNWQQMYAEEMYDKQMRLHEENKNY